MKKIIVVLLSLVSTSVLAQTQPPAEQAMGAKIIQEIQTGLQCSTNLITTQAELEKAKARIKELETPKDVK